MAHRLLNAARSRALLGALVGACALAGAACSDPPAARDGERVVIAGEPFYLEPALDDATRFRGLSGRESIPPDGGMIFVFPRPYVLQFVMRDCLTDIDIAFLDDAGRVTALHTMTTDPRRDGESDQDYEQRLRKYSSRYASRFAIEVAPGTLARLHVKEGDLVSLDTEGLKRRAR